MPSRLVYVHPVTKGTRLITGNGSEQTNRKHAKQCRLSRTYRFYRPSSKIVRRVPFVTGCTHCLLSKPLVVTDVIVSVSPLERPLLHQDKKMARAH